MGGVARERERSGAPVQGRSRWKGLTALYKKIARNTRLEKKKSSAGRSPLPMPPWIDDLGGVSGDFVMSFRHGEEKLLKQKKEDRVWNLKKCTAIEY